MTAGPATIAPFYADWSGYNRRMVEHLRSMRPEDLALEDGTRHWPIWAIAAHTVGARVFWLCHVLGEPGAEETPFLDPTGFGWEDDLAVVHSFKIEAFALLGGYVKVVGPEFDEDFVQLTAAVNLTKQRARSQLARDHLAVHVVEDFVAEVEEVGGAHV